MTNTEQNSSIFVVSDGRRLGYIDHATNDLSESAPTILYFHGFPGSRLESSIAAPRARAHGARLIALDRPGMGLSSFQPLRTLADWPKDVLELVDHLRIDKFYILGVSGGGPYVITCAKVIPRRRLLGAAIVAGVYPLSLGTEGMLIGVRVLLWTAASRWLSGAVAPLLDWQMGSAARDDDHPERLTKLFMREMEGRHERDLRCLDDLVFRTQLIEGLREAFRQDSYGVAWEAKLYGSEWGFPLEEVDFEGMDLWHGRLDINVPVATAEKAASLLRGAKLRVVDEESHLSLPVNNLDKILGCLLAEHTQDKQAKQ